jgi:hypothetical protein
MPEKNPPWRLETLSPSVHRITFDITSHEQECSVLLRSDAHHDNPQSDNEMERRHLIEAKQMNAPIIDNGDAFCSMQGRWDKRSDKNKLKPEHQCIDYLDALVTTYADFLKPYSKQLAVMGTGNHETAILKHHETNLTSRLVERLKTMSGDDIQEAGYTSWLFVSIRYNPPKSNPKAHKPMNTIKIWRTHGYGGAAPVTKGVIQTNRRAVYTPDANLIISGHTHQEWYFPIQRQRVDRFGNVSQDEQLHISMPSYKDGYGIGQGGWEIEKGFPPAPRGAVWLKLKMQGQDKRIVWDTRRAK